MIEDIETL